MKKVSTDRVSNEIRDEIEKIVDELFHNKTKSISLSDDYWMILNICPNVDTILSIYWRNIANYDTIPVIKITKKVIKKNFQNYEITEKTVWEGEMPQNKDYLPDYEFIKTLLSHFQKL